MASGETYNRLKNTTTTDDQDELLLNDHGARHPVPEFADDDVAPIRSEASAIKKSKKVLEVGKALFKDQSRGLRIIVICSFVFFVIIIVALILSIYLGPPQEMTSTEKADKENGRVVAPESGTMDPKCPLANNKMSNSFLQDDSSTGRCVWYDQCGPGFNPDTYLNCPATNLTRHGPHMKSVRGLEILKRYCPNIYKGTDNTRTCCSESQLISLESSLEFPQQMFSRCTNCLENWLNLFCQITCGLNQADFIWPDMKATYPVGYHYTPKGIPAVTVSLATQYAEGFYNSCKDVQYSHYKSISLFCGTLAKDCNATKLLDYIGNISNGRAAFPSVFLLQTYNWTSPDNTTLTPLNDTFIPCNASSENHTACFCRDCPESCPDYCIPNRTQELGLHLSTNADIFHSQCRSPFRRTQLLITRPWNHTKIIHPYPPPIAGSINFTSLFGLDFLHKVLELQINITALPVRHSGGDFNFTGICYKPAAPENEHCAVESILQYWQNNKTKLDKIVWDEYLIFDLADHFDHFLSCTNNPYARRDSTRLFMSCRANYGGVMKPMNILGSYDGTNYQNATAFVMSFYLNTTDSKQCSKAHQWNKVVDRYLSTCLPPDMMVSLWP